MKIFLYFIFIGGLGFLIDGGLMTLLSKIYLLNIYLSRLASFSVAVLVTWFLNRTLVFKADVDIGMQKAGEYTRYLLVQIVGALTNLIIFTLLILKFQFMKSIPIIPLFIGAFFGLIINFSGSHWWVFRGRFKQDVND